MKDVHVGVGVRVWQTDWSTWGDAATNNYGHGDLRYTVIPVLTASYGKWFVAGSYQLPTTFQFRHAGFNQDFERKEYDVNVGYFVLPGLAVTAGYKHMDYHSKFNNYSWSAKGPTVGVAGNAPIAEYVSLYGNMAYGWPQVHDSAETFSSSRGKYLLTEFGLAFPLGPHASALQGAVFTAGYRYQRVGQNPDSSVGTDELFETTQGPVVGFAMRF